MPGLFIAILGVAIAAAVRAGLSGQTVVLPGAAAAEAERFAPYAPFEAGDLGEGEVAGVTGVMSGAGS
ncbi:hypothetical protein [Streptomyces sp. NPDC002588]|uniref:hypothetical protein n=1 Tax=Streptomyces sp. NPDC002588 TaxID=3154419 RepID=UPI0033208AD6